MQKIKRFNKLIFALVIALIFVITIFASLPSKVYASEVESFSDTSSSSAFTRDIINDKYSDLVLSNNYLDFNKYLGITNTHYCEVSTSDNNIVILTTENNGDPYSFIFDITSLESGVYTFSFKTNTTEYNSNYLFQAGNYISFRDVITFEHIKGNDTRIRLSGIPYSSDSVIYYDLMLNKGSTPLPYEPYINGSMIYQEAYNKALLSNMYWLNDYNTSFVNISDYQTGISYNELDNPGLVDSNISYTTGLYGKADFNNIINSFAEELYYQKDIYEQELELELSFNTPIIFNDTTSTNFTTNDITGFTFITSTGNEYHYDFVSTSEGVKDYVHDISEGQDIYNKSFTGVRIRFLACNYPSVPEASISFIPDFYNEGYSAGYDNGYAYGNSSGYASGEATGYNNGYEEGYLSGYTEGKEYGFQTAGDLAVLPKNFINAMFSTPINIFKSLLNWEFFGINLFGVLTSLLTIAVVVFLFRKFKK